jgi:acetoin:2,6-dichlorophenolindophenol oxidoreductase subunit alpha
VNEGDTRGAAGSPAGRELLRCMLRARRAEERLIRLYHQGKVYGGVYTGTGHEAIGAATALAGGLRDLTVHLARGQSLLNVFRQWLARRTGPTGGRDGNVHHGSLPNGVYAMISHLGAMLAVLVGGVMGRRHLGEDTVGMVYLGDGASSSGDFHEGLNFAAVRGVPVLLVLENNRYAYSTPTALQYKCESLVFRAPGYGVDGHQADGNDAVALHELTRQLVDDMRRHPRPILLECMTMRMRGHGEHDDFSYVPRALLEEYAQKDPIDVAVRRLLERGALTRADVDALEAEVRAEVDAAYMQALAEPKPDPATLLDGVYAP